MKVTFRVLEERIHSGRGSHHGEAYQPWLWIHHKNVSSQGIQSIVPWPLPGCRRQTHFFSLIERAVAHLCMYLGAADCREQLPNWPMEHPHSLSDSPLAADLRFERCRGLVDIAKEAGIEHGTEPGTRVPYVATVDVGATVLKDSVPYLALIAVKPHDLVMGDSLEPRVVERLALQMLYAKEAGGSFAVVDKKLFGRHLAGNLEFFGGAARLPNSLQARALIEDFCGRVSEKAATERLDEVLIAVADAMSLAPDAANLLWRHGVWTHLIDMDLTQPREMSLPVTSSGKEINKVLAHELFGNF